MNNQFVVFEGLDGSGKKTQTDLLIKHLQDNDQKVETISFPQYGKKSAGMVEKYLKDGEYGSAKEVGPKIASIFYASDRYDGSFQIQKWLEEGVFVIADRYVSSNAAHQGGKIEDEKDREEFIKWVYDLEFELFNIPKPDKVIFLKITPEFSVKSTKNRHLPFSEDDMDIHEGNLSHLKGAYDAYMQLAEREENFEVVEVTENGEFLPPEEIHKKIINIIES